MYEDAIRKCIAKVLGNKVFMEACQVFFKK